MKKPSACLLALPLALAACGVQNVPAQTAPAHRYPGRDTGTHDCKYCAGRGTRGIV